MCGIARRLTFCVVLWVLGPFTAFGGQQAADPPPAPVPTQILTAKKVFISNASGVTTGAAAAPDLPYNEFYTAVKSWGRYELIGAPADADLVFELRYIIALGPTTNGLSMQFPEFTLVVLDPKTKIILWAFTESLHKTGKQTGRQTFDEALGRIVEDVKRLTAQPAAGAVNR